MPSSPPDSLRLVSFRKIRAAFIGGLSLLFLASARAQSTSPNYVFTHLAGPLGGPGSIDATGSAARFTNPNGVAVDNSGNIYVADTNNHTIRKITSGGVVSTFAGTPGVFGSTDGTGSAALFYYPSGVTVDLVGNVYVADRYNHVIRKITSTGLVTTLAGMAGVTGSTDGTGASARFFGPKSITMDSAGNAYVADSGNHTIRLITPAGVVTTFAGTAGALGSTDGIGGAAKFYSPNGVAVDAAGQVYVADQGNSTIRKITPTGMVTTLAGTAGHYGDGKDGTGSAAVFFYPGGVAADASGNVFVADGCYANALDYGFTHVSDYGDYVPYGANHTIRKITPDRVVTTLAGTAGRTGSADGIGAAAQFVSPQGLAVDLSGNVHVADSWNHSIRKITPSGTVTTLAGMAGLSGSTDGAATNAGFNHPVGVAVDSAGNSYVADTNNCTIRKITPSGTVTTLAGTAGAPGQEDGIGAAARFRFPTHVAVDRTGNVYVADRGNFVLRKITPTGIVTTSKVYFQSVVDVAVDRADNVYVADFWGYEIVKLTPTGEVSTTFGGPLSSLYHPMGVAVDGAGNLYVTLADGYLGNIKKIAPNGVISSLLAGTVATPWDFLRSILLSPQSGFYPLNGNGGGIAVDTTGNVYVADYWFHTITKITPEGAIASVGGLLGARGSTDGSGSAAQFNYPGGIATDNAGNLYVADTGNNAIRKGQPAGPPVITTQPSGQTVSPGTNVQFSVTASAVPAPTYQWYFNGNAFSGATTSTLSFTSARSVDAGDYTVIVTNELGSVTSTKAALTISSTPAAIASPASASGGGAIEGWFALAVIILALLRSISPRAIRP